MVSGAGDAVSHRRRDLRSGSLLFSFLFVTLPKNPNLTGESPCCNKGHRTYLEPFISKSGLENSSRHHLIWIWIVTPQPFRSGSSKISTKAPLHQTSSTVSRDVAVAQIWRLYCSGKQTKSDPALRPSSSHKSTKNQSETPTTRHPNSLHSATISSSVSHLKDRPLPPPSTLTPAHPSPSPAPRSKPSTLTPANPPCLTLPSTRNPASTQHPVRPSTMTPASTQHLGGGASDATGAALGFCLLGLSHCNGPPLVSRPTGEISRPRTENFIPNLCQNLSFRLIPRSKNSTANDLAKKAIWSMTQAHLCSM